MLKSSLILLAIVLLIGVSIGCTQNSIAKVAPVPEDIFRYEPTGVTSDGRVFTRSFALMESKVEVTNFCSDCVAEYHTAIWYVPNQTDRYIGDKLEGNRTADTAILSKPLYRNDELRVSYLDSIFSIKCYNGNGTPISEIKPEVVSYNPATRELLLDGFPSNSQTWFTITYFYNQPQRFKVYCTSPGNNLADGYIYDKRVVNWVKIPQKLQVVSPFTIRHIPITLEIPDNISLPKGYKFEFWINVGEVAEGSSSMETTRAYQQRWLITCR